MTTAAQSPPAKWLAATAFWAHNEDGTGKGRLYTYMVPPGYECRPGDQILVEGPQGQPKFLTVEDIREYVRQEFKCKPIALRIPKHEWQANEDLRAAAKAAGDKYDGPAPATYSHHSDFHEWVNEVERMWVEGI